MSVSHVVGIGASAGGLEAFVELLLAMPPSTGMAFVMIQHLEPHYKSELAEILARSTSMPVVQATEGSEVEANHVYVIPPNTVMVIRGGVLHLEPRNDSVKPNYPIDIFFESLAADQGAKAIAVVLSGTASDGAQGVRAIKQQGGATFSQDEQSAKYAGMPHNAISTGAIDWILAPKRIAEELARIDSHPYLSVFQLEEPDTSAQDERNLQQIVGRLQKATKVDFTQYKLNTIRRRLGRRLFANHLETLSEYVEFLDWNPGEIHELYRDILISVTSFFREPEMFETLKTCVRQYLQARRSSILSRFRSPSATAIWF